MADHRLTSGASRVARAARFACTAAVTALLLATLSNIAYACPNCAIREQTPGRTLLVIGMILLPWTMVGLTLFAIRKVTQNESQSKEEIS